MIERKRTGKGDVDCQEDAKGELDFFKLYLFFSKIFCDAFGTTLLLSWVFYPLDEECLLVTRAVRHVNLHQKSIKVLTVTGR